MSVAIPLLAAMLVQAGSGQLPADPRIQTYPYSMDAVVTLAVVPGYAAVIELAAGEQIDTVVVGNSSVWQITETGTGNRLVVKPLDGAARTNLVVMTDTRRYVFALDPAGSPDATSFVVRFAYPDPSGSSPAASTATYRFRGDRRLFPMAMGDDGRVTRVRWARQTPLPAIVSIAGGTEALVNGQMIGNDYVIEGTAARYKFRYGDAEADAIRQPAKRSRK